MPDRVLQDAVKWPQCSRTGAGKKAVVGAVLGWGLLAIVLPPIMGVPLARSGWTIPAAGFVLMLSGMGMAPAPTTTTPTTTVTRPPPSMIFR
ncbi:hypothetical protein ABW21_db0201431 [Orbilia brochopaga]|nr:hypothetical protein ABW21_db0201431 [Drechslerella brochopaga]